MMVSPPTTDVRPVVSDRANQERFQRDLEDVVHGKARAVPAERPVALRLLSYMYGKHEP
jgi:hypothetical protein